MSIQDDMLGKALQKVLRKLVDLPVEKLRVIYDLLERLLGKEGERWFTALKLFLRQEHLWRVPTKISVITKGQTGEQFIRSLAEQGVKVGDRARQLLTGRKFITTNGVTHELVFMLGSDIGSTRYTNGGIRSYAQAFGYITPPPEVALYLREMISQDDMKQAGLSGIIVMHEPIADIKGNPRLLAALRRDDGPWLETYPGQPEHKWFFKHHAFVFLSRVIDGETQ